MGRYVCYYEIRSLPRRKQVHRHALSQCYGSLTNQVSALRLVLESWVANLQPEDRWVNVVSSLLCPVPYPWLLLSSSHAHYHSLSLPLSHCSDSVRVVAEQHLPQLITDLSAITDQVGAASLRGIMQHFKNFVSSVRS